jgi:hypothetical protein
MQIFELLSLDLERINRAGVGLYMPDRNWARIQPITLATSSLAV